MWCFRTEIHTPENFPRAGTKSFVFQKKQKQMFKRKKVRKTKEFVPVPFLSAENFKELVSNFYAQWSFQTFLNGCLVLKKKQLNPLTVQFCFSSLLFHHRPQKTISMVSLCWLHKNSFFFCWSYFVLFCFHWFNSNIFFPRFPQMIDHFFISMTSF